MSWCLGPSSPNIGQDLSGPRLGVDQQANQTLNLRVGCIFPHDAAIIRLVGALLLEHQEQRQLEARIPSMCDQIVPGIMVTSSSTGILMTWLSSRQP
jgi:hypothetical protein